MNVAPRPSRSKPRGTGAVVLTAGGLLAGFAAAACCALPLLLGALGLGSAWLFGVAAVAAPHRTGILIVGGAALALAAVLWWRQRTAVCEPGAWCAKPGVRVLTLIGLVIGAALLVAGYVYV
ncbi:MAG: mercuric reductase [Proteobacteria bacterium]|nr:mercuric reductase [Pseudomonadota bacterium]